MVSHICQTKHNFTFIFVSCVLTPMCLTCYIECLRINIQEATTNHHDVADSLLYFSNKYHLQYSRCAIPSLYYSLILPFCFTLLSCLYEYSSSISGRRTQCVRVLYAHMLLGSVWTSQY